MHVIVSVLRVMTMHGFYQVFPMVISTTSVSALNPFPETVSRFPPIEPVKGDTPSISRELTNKGLLVSPSN